MAWPSALLLDLQGVLVEDQRAFPGAVHTVNLDRRRGGAIRFVQALEYGADCTALVMGKPSAVFFREAAAKDPSGLQGPCAVHRSHSGRRRRAADQSTA